MQLPDRLLALKTLFFLIIICAKLCLTNGDVLRCTLVQTCKEDESSEFITSLILLSKHLVIKHLTEEEHLDNKHTGTSILLIILRERFWVIKSRRTVHSIFNDCIACKKQKIKNSSDSISTSSSRSD